MRLICVFLCLVVIQNLQMIIRLAPEEKKCFYQQLSLRQKYAVDIYALNVGDFQLDIKHLNHNTQWVHSVNRQSEQNTSSISVHKLASHQTTYSICIASNSLQDIKLKVNIKWGLQLLDFNVLVQEDDQKVLEEYSKSIDDYSNKILEVVDTVSNRRSIKQQLKNILTFKYVVFAIIGILLLVVINIYFYSSLKKTFRQRKMI